MKYSIAAIVLFIAVPLMAQQPAAPEQPKITELQATKLELYQTKINDIVNVANAQIAPLSAQRMAVIQEIAAANPGWTWHEASTPGDQSRWIKTPPPAPPAKAEAPKK